MTLTLGSQSTNAQNVNDLLATKTFNAGDWLFAIAAVRVTDGSTPAMYVGDAARNIWQLLYSGTTVADSTHAAAQMHVQVWASPAARMDGWADILRVTGATMSILTADTGSAVWNVFTVTGFTGGHLTVDSVTLGTANAATSFSVISPAPTGSVNCLHVGAACVDDDTATITETGAGFTALNQTSLTTPGVKISGQIKAATTGQTASWTSGSAVNWTGVIVAVREVGIVPAGDPSPYLIGTNSQASGVSASIVASVATAAPVGDSVAVALGSSGGTDVVSVVDSKGNTYAPVVAETGGTPRSHLYKSDLRTALLVSDTITATFSSSANAFNIIAAGHPGGMDVDVTNHAFGTSTSPAATSAALSSGYELAIGVVSDGNGGGSPTWPAGWTVLSTQHNGSTQWTSAAYKATASTAAITASATIVSAAWTALVACFRPRRGWPLPKLELGLGYDMSTPLAAVQWTDQTTRLVDIAGSPVLAAPRGIPYELGEAQSEPADIVIRNDDGAYTPRTVNTAASANAAGTTSTVKFADANATNIHVADFFRLKTSALVLKEQAVFIVTAVASAAGTTTVTFIRADGSGVALAATASGDVYAGIPIDLSIPWRYSMYWNGRWWPVGAGWLGQLPQTWTNAWWGRVGAVGIDGLATLTAANPSALGGEILRRGPLAYWTLGDSASAGQAQDVSGNNAPALVQVSSKFGTGASGSADFGASTQQVDNGITFPATASKTTLIGDTGSGWAQTGFTAAELNTNQGFALLGQGLDIDITRGVTICGFVMMNTADIALIGGGGGTTFDQTVMIVRNTDPAAGVGQGAVLKVSVEHTGANILQPKVSVWDKDTHAVTTTAAGSPQMVSADFSMWMVAFDRTSWTFYDKGDVVSGSADLVDTINLIDIAGESDRFFTGRMMNALHCHVAIFGRKLSTAEAAAIRSAGTNGNPFLNGETLSGRVARKLNTVGWRGPRVIHDSDLVVAAEGEDSGTAAELVQDLSGNEDGWMFLDALGQLQWRGHIPGYYQTSKVTFGERTDLGEIPYQPGQSYGFDSTFIYNDVEITNQRVVGFSAASATLTTAADTASAAKYGKRSLVRTTRLASNADPYGLAWSLLNRYKQPELRVGQIVVDCATYPGAWETCLGLEIGDLVTVSRRPLNAPTITQLYRVLQAKPEIGPEVAMFTYALALADDPVIVLGLGAQAVIGNGTIGW